VTTPTQNDRHRKDTGYLRAAVVQLGFHPAFTPSRARSLIEDPLGAATLPVGVGPDALTSANDLRGRVAAVYEEQLRLKVVAILEWCAEWNVDVVVFPEYSLPPNVLPDVARVGGAMVVVAGSHLVDRAALKAAVYKGLASPETPALNTAVCPVFSNGNLIACVPKLHPSPIDGEREALEPGTNWHPVELAEGIMGPMGVLLCVDFIDREDERVASAVSPYLGNVRFWAVPSYTPQTHDFHEQARKQAVRYKQPTFYANSSEKGGSGVFVDTRTPNDAGLPWQLSAKEEGVLVVDVDLRDVPPGKSTAYGARAVSRVVAAPSLVYKSNHHDAVYVEWLESILAESGSDLERLERVASTKSKVEGFLERGALPPTRKKRLEQFASTADSLSKASELESLTAEIILPSEALPLKVLEAALCKGARAVVSAWPPGALDETERAEIDRKLVEGSEALVPGQYAPSTAEAKGEIKRTVDRVRGDAPPFDEPMRMAQRLELYSTELQGVWKREFDEARELLNAEQYDAASEGIERLTQAIRAHLEKAPNDEVALARMARVQLVRSLLHFNCQEPQQARDTLQSIDPERLEPNEWLNLARIWAELEEAEEARKWISRAEEAKRADIDPKWLTVTKQIVMMKSGTMPSDPLVEEPDVLLRAAELSLEQGALAQGVQYACQSVLEEKSSLMQMAGAFSVVVRSLHWSIFELAEGARLLAPSELETAIASAERWLERLEQPGGGLRALSLPTSIVDQLEAFRSLYYYFVTADPDHAERHLKRTEDPNLERAFELARDGQTDEAMALLPKTENPWVPVVQRADYLSLSGKDDNARLLLRDLAMRYPKRGPIELRLAELELRSGSANEALEHAKQAYDCVPARGYRWLLAQCLVKNDRPEQAWELLSKERARGGWNIIQLLARIAATVHPDEAPKLWATLVEMNPENVPVRLAWAHSQSQLGNAEQAAETAWSAFQRYDTKFTIRDLGVCAELQLNHDATGLRTFERVRRIHKLLHERFAGEPEAESLKLRLSLRLGDDPELPRTDFDVLEEHGFVRKFSADDMLPMFQKMIQEWRQRGEAMTRLYAAGAIPLATLVAPGNQTIAELVDSVLDGVGPKVCAALPPSGTRSALNAIEILATDVELLVIAKLGLTRSLADALRRGRSTLVLSDTYYRRLLEQQATLQGRGGGGVPAQLVHLALDLVHTGKPEGWVRIATWIEAQAGLVKPPMPDKPPLREAELGDHAETWRTVLEAPLHEAIDLAGAVLASPKRWRLATDFFGTWSPGTPELMRSLAWSSPDHALKTSRFLRRAGRRCITLPTLVRLLSEHRSVGPISHELARLARSGFPDAINAAEIVEHVRSSAEVRFPEEALSGLENMARQDDIVVGTRARDHLCETYAEAIARAFLGEWRSEGLSEPPPTFALTGPYGATAGQFGVAARNPLSLDQARLLAATLLERVETLDTKGTTLVQAVMAGTLRHALRDPHRAVEPDLEHADRVILTLNSAVGRLIETMHSWSGPSGSRWAAWGRALRESYCVMDSFSGPGGPTTPQIAALLLASSASTKRPAPSESATQNEPPEPLNTLGTPPNEALAILSANWKERPLNRRGLTVQTEPESDHKNLQFDWETLLVHAASTMGAESFDERELLSSLPLPDTAGHFPIELPVEAVLLRVPPDVARQPLERLRELQGPHDGKAYEFLNRIQDAPDDTELRSEYARYTVMAPWRLVRDDPAFLIRWPESHTTALGMGFPQLGDLLSILHEPRQPLGAVPSAADLIQTRFTDTWRELHENVRSALYLQVRQLPGAATVHVPEDLGVLSQSVESALQRFDNVHEVPAGWLAQDIIVVRVAMHRSPVLSLSSGTVDLRERAPRVIAEVIDKVSSPNPPAGSIAEHETMLLRVCASVCGRFFRNQFERGQADWLWLTHRLHAWFVTQMGGISPSLRRDGIEALARLAPPQVAAVPDVESLPDLFDARFFEARGFNYRLSMVLFALMASDEWVHAEVAKSGSNKTIDPVSTPGLERQLVGLAAKTPPDCRQAGSWFHWPLPSNTADLALLALLRINDKRVSELPEESLVARIVAWPAKFSTLSDGQRSCIHALVGALSYHIRDVHQPVRSALEAKLMEWQESDDMVSFLRWVGLTSLFRAGAFHLQELVRSLVCDRYHDTQTPFVLGWYLEGVARAGGSLEVAVERLSDHWKGKGSTGTDPLVLALARLTLHAEQQVQEEARTLLVALAGRPDFVDSSLLQGLAKHLRLSAPENGQ
jgi:predicted amidohydrolase/tetratricopeptide (TPR) repeat protein